VLCRNAPSVSSMTRSPVKLGKPLP
jgi:hypothetical protein